MEEQNDNQNTQSHQDPQSQSHQGEIQLRIPLFIVDSIVFVSHPDPHLPPLSFLLFDPLQTLNINR